jgi:MoaA/NifB/PqqE/SkfB family radical SAM enzyme
MTEGGLVRIWYVSSQRLCNFRCSYCVSTEDYAKSNTLNWLKDTDQANFETIVRWIGTRPFPVGVRLATLGEPFASWDFLRQTAWLTQQDGVRFVELLTNGSLLKQRLPKISETTNLERLSLWITWHPTEISIDRLLEGAILAQEQYGCFVVINSLLFPDNIQQVDQLRTRATQAGLRFNLDLGYDASGEYGTYSTSDEVVPIKSKTDWQAEAVRLGADPHVLSINLAALDDVRGKACSAGHDNLFIGIDGEVYPCSRYSEIGESRLGNILDPDFELNLRPTRWADCRAANGCSNKEDFLNLQIAERLRDSAVPSLGWTSR